jgi:uncharacterized membrane protein YhaH (DUF805 family)
MKKYANFNGRATRSEFWWFQVFQSLAWFSIVVVGEVLGLSEEGTIALALVGLAYLLSLAWLLPALAVFVHRLHDVNRSGWWILIGGLCFYWLCKQGDPETNAYGPNPALAKPALAPAQGIEGNAANPWTPRPHYAKTA